MSDTSDHLPLDPDELASSYLDGELPDDQRALVEADPALMALVERHRQVREALARPVEPLPAEQREAMLAAALAALPAVADAGTAAAGAAGAAGCGRRRRRRASSVVERRGGRADRSRPTSPPSPSDRRWAGRGGRGGGRRVGGGAARRWGRWRPGHPRQGRDRGGVGGRHCGVGGRQRLRSQREHGRRRCRGGSGRPPLDPGGGRGGRAARRTVLGPPGRGSATTAAPVPAPSIWRRPASRTSARWPTGPR